MKKLSTLLVAIIASVVMTGAVLADQTERDQQMEFESRYLDSDE